MTPKEALKLVKSGNPVGFQVPLYHQALDIMENLIAKATPMKPQMRHYDKSIFRDIGLCECSKWCSEYENYCSECGQKLDWSDEK